MGNRITKKKGEDAKLASRLVAQKPCVVTPSRSHLGAGVTSFKLDSFKDRSPVSWLSASANQRWSVGSLAINAVASDAYSFGLRN
jgi:hypothetical protein